MTQSKLSSFIEANVSTLIGFFVSLIIGHFAFPAFGCAVSFAGNFGLTLIFTVASIIRGYYVRRWFNHTLTRRESHGSTKSRPTA